MTEGRKGNIFIIGEMVLWSLFPIISILGLKGIPSLVSLFWVNVFALGFFFLIILFRGKLFELRNKKVWLYTLGTVLFINIIFYGLFFYALGKTTPANASIVALFEIVPTYIFFHILKKEHFDKKHLLGIFLAIIGVLIILLPQANGINVGDFIILIAVFAPPFGNWCQQKARAIVSSETALFLRHFISIPFLFLLTLSFGTPIHNYEIGGVFWWLLLNGILIFGISKIFWLEAIHRMSVTRALAINGLNPVFTVFFAWIILSQTPTSVQFIAIPFLFVSILILTNFKFKKHNDEKTLV